MVTSKISGSISNDYSVDNDSYLMIIYGKNSGQLKIADYSESDKQDIANGLNNSININGVGKAILAGVTSPLAQSIASKNLPKALVGRVNSSLFDIVKDGKISNKEVAGDFISSCTNELDATAIAMGLPSASGLYEALMPNGSGIIATDFLNHFSKQSKKIADDELKKENENKSAASVLKLKIIIDETETYPSELPKRRTEKGFNYVDYVHNDEVNLDFNAIIGGIGLDLYTAKDKLVSIRNSKETFEVYINDKTYKKQYHYQNCLFENLSFSSDTSSDNTKSVSITLQPIPEAEIINTYVDANFMNSKIATSARKTSGSKKDVKANVKSKAKSHGSSKVGMPVNGLDSTMVRGRIKIMSEIATDNNTQYSPLKDPLLKNLANSLGISTQKLIQEATKGKVLN